MVELGLFAAQVVEIGRVSPNMTRVRVKVARARDYPASVLPDDRVRLYLPDAEVHDTEQLAYELERSPMSKPERALPVSRRSYTIREHHVDAGLLDIDFAVHAQGAAMQWLRGLAPGEWVAVSRAGGWYRPPIESGRLVLGSDLSGLPALQRILSEKPSASRAEVVLCVPDERDIRELPQDLTVDYHILVAPYAAASAALVGRLETIAPAIDYFWLAAEAAACQQMKVFARERWGLSATRMQVRAYWRTERSR